MRETIPIRRFGDTSGTMQERNARWTQCRKGFERGIACGCLIALPVIYIKLGLNLTNGSSSEKPGRETVEIGSGLSMCCWKKNDFRRRQHCERHECSEPEDHNIKNPSDELHNREMRTWRIVQ